MRRKSVFKKAEKRAKEVNKKLLVIGDPSNGGFNYMFGTVYG